MTTWRTLLYLLCVSGMTRSTVSHDLVEPGPIANCVNVVRSRVLQCALRTFNRRAFNPYKQLDVVFVDSCEQGRDLLILVVLPGSSSGYWWKNSWSQETLLDPRTARALLLIPLVGNYYIYIFLHKKKWIAYWMDWLRDRTSTYNYIDRYPDRKYDRWVDRKRFQIKKVPKSAKTPI